MSDKIENLTSTLPTSTMNVENVENSTCDVQEERGDAEMSSKILISQDAESDDRTVEESGALNYESCLFEGEGSTQSCPGSIIFNEALDHRDENLERTVASVLQVLTSNVGETEPKHRGSFQQSASDTVLSESTSEKIKASPYNLVKKNSQQKEVKAVRQLEMKILQMEAQEASRMASYLKEEDKKRTADFIEKKEQVLLNFKGASVELPTSCECTNVSESTKSQPNVMANDEQTPEFSTSGNISCNWNGPTNRRMCNKGMSFGNANCKRLGPTPEQLHAKCIGRKKWNQCRSFNTQYLPSAKRVRSNLMLNGESTKGMRKDCDNSNEIKLKYDSKDMSSNDRYFVATKEVSVGTAEKDNKESDNLDRIDAMTQQEFQFQHPVERSFGKHNLMPINEFVQSAHHAEENSSHVCGPRKSYIKKPPSRSNQQRYNQIQNRLNGIRDAAHCIGNMAGQLADNFSLLTLTNPESAEMRGKNQTDNLSESALNPYGDFHDFLTTLRDMDETVSESNKSGNELQFTFAGSTTDPSNNLSSINDTVSSPMKKEEIINHNKEPKSMLRNEQNVEEIDSLITKFSRHLKTDVDEKQDLNEEMLLTLASSPQKGSKLTSSNTIESNVQQDANKSTSQENAELFPPFDFTTSQPSTSAMQTATNCEVSKKCTNELLLNRSNESTENLINDSGDYISGGGVIIIDDMIGKNDCIERCGPYNGNMSRQDDNRNCNVVNQEKPVTVGEGGDVPLLSMDEIGELSSSSEITLTSSSLTHPSLESIATKYVNRLANQMNNPKSADGLMTVPLLQSDCEDETNDDDVEFLRHHIREYLQDDELESVLDYININRIGSDSDSVSNSSDEDFVPSSTESSSAHVSTQTESESKENKSNIQAEFDISEKMESCIVDIEKHSSVPEDCVLCRKALNGSKHEKGESLDDVVSKTTPDYPDQKVSK